MSFLTVDIAQKAYANACVAIQDLRFSATQGEFIAIVGPSGAGKSTLLNLVSGLDRDFSGSIQFAGQTLAESRLQLGFLFQESRLMPWLTVRDNLALVLKNKPDLAQTQSVDTWLDRVGLHGMGGMFPGQLSGGMQRRVALVRAFIVNPDVLLMDEPFQSLDAPTAGQLRLLLHELWTLNSPTVLFVTHNLREAISLAGRILFLSARPAQVILEYPLNLARPTSIEDDGVAAAHQKIMALHPQLLAGLHEPPPVAPG